MPSRGGLSTVTTDTVRGNHDNHGGHGRRGIVTGTARLREADNHLLRNDLFPPTPLTDWSGQS